MIIHSIHSKSKVFKWLHKNNLKKNNKYSTWTNTLIYFWNELEHSFSMLIFFQRLLTVFLLNSVMTLFFSQWNHWIFQCTFFFSHVIFQCLLQREKYTYSEKVIHFRDNGIPFSQYCSSSWHSGCRGTHRDPLQPFNFYAKEWPMQIWVLQILRDLWQLFCKYPR